MARTRTWNVRVWRPLFCQLNYHYLTPGVSRVHSGWMKLDLEDIGAIVFALCMVATLVMIVMAVTGHLDWNVVLGTN